jgi:hypothetical protein
LYRHILAHAHVHSVYLSTVECTYQLLRLWLATPFSACPVELGTYHCTRVVFW